MILMDSEGWAMFRMRVLNKKYILYVITHGVININYNIYNLIIHILFSYTQIRLWFIDDSDDLAHRRTKLLLPIYVLILCLIFCSASISQTPSRAW